MDEAAKSLIQELNILNAKYNCIETKESEELMEYISNILQFTNNDNLLDVIDKMRAW